MKQVIFADFRNPAARSLAADAMRQLGYQAESALWRNFYLSGALELEKGVARLPASSPLDQYASALTLPMIVRSMAVRVDGPRAEGHDVRVTLRLTDSKEVYDLRLHNAVLTYAAVTGARTGTVVSMSRADLLSLLAGRTTLKDGDNAALRELLGLLSSYHNDSALVSP
jgi:alkyl sulfatase BDS1-like metallo-beta-lactamase superfamily hydrolase